MESMIRPTPDHHLGTGGGGLDNRGSFASILMQSDLDADSQQREQQMHAAQFALDRLGEWLEHADESLSQLENEQDKHDAVGNAIVRGCQDLANAIGSLANQLEHQSDDERRALAQACLQDVHTTLLLNEETEYGQQFHASSDNPRANDDALVGAPQNQLSPTMSMQSVSEDEMVSALQVAGSLLRDVELTLRAMDKNDANEIADVGLTVAHLFVASLQSIHSTVSPEDLTQHLDPHSANRATQTTSSMSIEMLDDDGDNADDNSFSQVHGAAQRTTQDLSVRYPSMKHDRSTTISTSTNRKKLERLRVLWPPLGPAVGQALQWGHETATQQPLLAVALGLTLWPAAVMTTLVGTPVVLVDRLVQDWYQTHSDGPIVQGLERSAAQVYQTGRLTFLCGKLVTRQAFRVAKRQVERRGGIEQIAHDVRDITIDRISHPVETIQMAWNGLSWGANLAIETWKQVTDQERDETIQRLQQ